jgi:Fe-S-cluster-containing hydrogenase component 2
LAGDWHGAVPIMRKVYLLAKVDRTRCIGDRICENVCPTGAIRMVGKKAVIDGEKCAACLKCIDYCGKEAIRMVPRPEPVLLSADPSEVDQDQLRELCQRAHLELDDVICPCTATRAREVGAAILQGARTPEDVSIRTGVRTACGMWCMALVQELLRAHGLEMTPPKGYHWYDVDTALWNVPDEVARKYPEYRLDEARRLFQAGAGGTERDRNQRKP